MSNRIKHTIKRALSVILSFCLFICGMPSYAFAKGENDRVLTFETTREDLEKAIIRDFSGDEKYSVKTDSGIEAFEIFPNMEKENVKNVGFNTYLIPFENTDDITGDEWVVFSVVNNNGNSTDAEISIDDISSGVFTVPSGTGTATTSDALIYNATVSDATISNAGRILYDAASESNAARSNDDDDEYYPDIDIMPDGMTYYAFDGNKSFYEEKAETAEPEFYMTDCGFIYTYTDDDGKGRAVFATTVSLLGLTFDDTGEEAEVYSVIYVNDNDDAVLIAGPDTISKGEDLMFTVTVAEGYELVETLINDEAVEPEETSEEIAEYSLDDEKNTVYEYTIRDVGENLIVTLSSVQIINGTGSMTAYGVNAVDDSPSYTITVADVSTNTEISVNSPRITVTDENGDSIYNAVLKDNLYYLADSGERTDVAYFVLTGEKDDEDENAETVFTLMPYDSEGNEITDDGNGQFILVVSSEILTTQIWRIQANYLCFLNESGEYQQEIIEAVSAFNPTIYYADNLSDGSEIAMTELTEEPDGEFYYGSADAAKFGLTRFTTGIVKDGIVYPEDSNGNIVENVSMYMVYDRLYSFDVELNSVVNEHTEDNGDVYLWTDADSTFYIDQYHAQGLDIQGYGRSQNILTDCGIWAQLGRIREEELLSGTKTFNDYANVSYADMTKVVDMTGYCPAMVADEAEKYAPYGVAGPFTFTGGESDVIPDIVRVTGRAGDRFTVNEAFNTDIAYMVTSQEIQTDWYNLGSHASDNGSRAWFYWIKDFYVLNNYEDELNYVELRDVGTGEIRLYCEEIGSDPENAPNPLYDLWDVSKIYTVRDSAVKEYMLANQEELETQGIGFYEYVGWPHHIQLRMNTTVETVIEDVFYSGSLDVTFNDTTPKITFSFTYTDKDGRTVVYEDSKILARDNEQETKSYTFDDGIYINPEQAFDDEYSIITVSLTCTGTLTGNNGNTISYTEDEPLIYEYTLTSEQLIEAYDDCPNNEGYDIAVNLRDAIQIEPEQYITLYKIWDDESNIYHTRDNVTSVVVSLERSKDRENWEIVNNELGETKPFSIYGDNSSSIWSLTLTGSDIDLTYEDEKGETKNYYFRIAEEQTINGLDEGVEYSYAYSAGDDDLSVIVTNTLYRYVFDITGEKKWTDLDGNPLEDDNEAIPDSIIVALYQNDEFYDMKTVYKTDGWTFTFENLPQVTGNNPYQYTIYELDTNGTRMGTGNVIFFNDKAFMISITKGTEEDGVDYVISNALCPSTPELPSSGGQGTKWFYPIGLGLITMTGILLIMRRRLKIR